MRGPIILLAYLASVFAATGVFGVLLAIADSLYGDPGRSPNLDGVLFVLSMVFLSVLILSFVPAFAAISLAEYFSIRRGRLFALMGLFISLVGVVTLSILTGFPLPERKMVLALACCGTVAGLVYWGIAGHNSGKLQNTPGMRKWRL